MMMTLEGAFVYISFLPCFCTDKPLCRACTKILGASIPKLLFYPPNTTANMILISVNTKFMHQTGFSVVLATKYVQSTGRSGTTKILLLKDAFSQNIMLILYKR